MGIMGRGVTGGDRGGDCGKDRREDRGRPRGDQGPNTTNNFCYLVVQLVAGNTLTMLNPQLVARKNVFLGDHESEGILTIFIILKGLFE